MPSLTKSKPSLPQALLPIAPGLIAYYTFSHGPSADLLRPVDIVLLLATGLCFGVTLSLVVLSRMLTHSAGSI